MTNPNVRFKDLTIICNGCGEPMRDFGEWPVQFPRDNKMKNIQRASRYACKTCKTPHDSHPPGVQVMISILEDEYPQ